MKFLLNSGEKMVIWKNLRRTLVKILAILMENLSLKFFQLNNDKFL